jgi:hypothetical protein
MGFRSHCPAEVVLTTFCPNGKPHASTTGAWAKGNLILLKIFTDTQTFRNLIHSRAAVINITPDRELLVKLALKDLLNFSVRELEFGKSKFVNAPRLKKADGFIEVEVKNSRIEKVSDEFGVSEISYFETGVKHIDIRKPRLRVQVIDKSRPGVLRGAVLATKIIVAVKKGRTEKAREVFDLLSKISKRIKRPKEKLLMAKVVEALGRRYGWGE